MDSSFDGESSRINTTTSIDNISVSEPPKNDENRILKRGDLARIIGRKGKLKDQHQGDLARVLRSISKQDIDRIIDDKDDDFDPHPFLYDLELVLGGKLNAIKRSDLQYTTAYAEGMTGDTRQQRKKRKPNPCELQLQQQEEETFKNGTKKKSTTKKTKTTVKNKKGTTTAAKATKGTKVSSNKTVNKKRGAKTKTTTKAGTKKQKVTKSTSIDESSLTTTTTTNGMDMFERHRREFERAITRLEKADMYRFFTDDDIPPEYDECYGDNDNEKSTNDTAEPVGTQQAPQHSKSTTQFPDHPPFNLVVLRKRMERGRYILDREKMEMEQRIDLMAPYMNSIGRKITTYMQKRWPNFNVLHKKGIDWDIFRHDVIGMCNAAMKRNLDMAKDTGPGTLSYTVQKIKDVVDQIYEKAAQKQNSEMALSNDAYRFNLAIQTTQNMEAAMQGKKWRREAFPERQYEKLRSDVVCAGLSELDERIAIYELKTSLKDSFVGLAYTYDDTGQSEGWMKTMISEAEDGNEQERAALALSSDDGVIKAQVAASMQTLLMAVQDRVMTDMGVLEQPELRSANWECDINSTRGQVSSCENSAHDNASSAEIVEQPVWGIDCYTRRNISICLETEFDHDTVLCFIEKWLLPAINACPVDLAYNLANAARVLEGLPFDESSSLNQDGGTTAEQWSTTLLGKALLRKINESAPPWLRSAAQLLRRAISSLGYDFFRVHPKGHGSVVLCPKIEPNRLVTFYRGEVYPSWRWGEKTDAISLIQQRKGLKPRLPDFYNMALERPQMDPRGYGLLFVDASRKSGYGSMLSHSCNPSCEVKVVAINGELTLAMTTLREMTIGEEVTFDYNAVTESLHEYQTAVCLCGHGQCRGSFLHFATADCYQQVLNRNSPVAVLLSQLIKGCMKKVMAEDDHQILKRHGFQTAAFGAVSVNRRKATNAGQFDISLDSMDYVPIWLRTFVADILRYIEYERRALPIALICNQITKSSNEDKKANSSLETGSKKESSTAKKSSSASSNTNDKPPPSIVEKPIKGSKPEPTFFYFCRCRREHFLSTFLKENAEASISGRALECELKKLAAAEWKTLDADTKQHWKEQSIADWERNGGKEKARLEKERIQRFAKTMSDHAPKEHSKNCSILKKENGKHEKNASAKQNDTLFRESNISFQAADAEGISAMEQRIQQLTQSLSRVGRILDRHREESIRRKGHSSGEQVDCPITLRNLAHSPLTIMPDEHVVAWMWNHEDGIVRTLLDMASREVCVSPDLIAALRLTESKYAVLSEFGTPWKQEVNSAHFPMPSSEGRKLLNEALLEFRMRLLEGMEAMASDIKSRRASARDKARKKKDKARQVDKIATTSSRSRIRFALKVILNEMIDEIEIASQDNVTEGKERKNTKDTPDIAEPWLQNFNKRFKLEKAADLLLMYSRTSTFFRLSPYQPLQSSPIEVYARELGNTVPRSVMDEKKEPTSSRTKFEKVEQLSDHLTSEVSAGDDELSDSSSRTGSDGRVKAAKKHERSEVCDPKDIISEVVVDYQGDYVLSQLLQWYNAGFDQKPGLPDILGCALLPSMSGCWTIDTTKSSSSDTYKWTGYRTNIRPRLFEWLKDPYKRGSPWPDELRRSFLERDLDRTIDDSTQLWLAIGSPVLDLLVTGDDSNLMDILGELGSDSTDMDGMQDGLMSTVDHGRPAQAVSNWVQCDNPNCQKWRKIPWYVDVDTLSEKFVCADNIWNKGSASCDIPEDDWDEEIDACVEADGTVRPKEMEKQITSTASLELEKNADQGFSCKFADFKVGAKLDVLRAGKTKKWAAATVIDVDFVGQAHRVKFHFPRTTIKHDEWLDTDSKRIAPLHTHTAEFKSKSQGRTAETDDGSSKKSTGLSKKLDRLKKRKKATSCPADTSQKKQGKEDTMEASSNSDDENDEMDTEEDYEEVGVGVIDDTEEIGSADEDESEDEIGMDDSDGDDKEETDEDGLDDSVEDDDDDVLQDTDNSDEEEEEEKELNKSESALPTVTDHSSPDGSPKRESDVYSAASQNDDKNASITESSPQSFTIPKKRPSPEESSSTTIPKKKFSVETKSLISNKMMKSVPVAGGADGLMPKKNIQRNGQPKKLLGIQIPGRQPQSSVEPTFRQEMHHQESIETGFYDIRTGHPRTNSAHEKQSPSSSVRSRGSPFHQSSTSFLHRSPSSALADESRMKLLERRREKEILREPASTEREKMGKDAYPTEGWPDGRGYNRADHAGYDDRSSFGPNPRHYSNESAGQASLYRAEDDPSRERGLHDQSQDYYAESRRNGFAHDRRPDYHRTNVRNQGHEERLASGYTATEGDYPRKYYSPNNGLRNRRFSDTTDDGVSEDSYYQRVNKYTSRGYINRDIEDTSSRVIRSQAYARDGCLRESPHRNRSVERDFDRRPNNNYQEHEFTAKDIDRGRAMPIDRHNNMSRDRLDEEYGRSGRYHDDYDKYAYDKYNHSSYHEDDDIDEFSRHSRSHRSHHEGERHGNHEDYKRHNSYQSHDGREEYSRRRMDDYRHRTTDRENYRRQDEFRSGRRDDTDYLQGRRLNDSNYKSDRRSASPQKKRGYDTSSSRIHK